MKEVIYADPKIEIPEKPVEFTHQAQNDGSWDTTSYKPEQFDYVIFRGHENGYDHFLAWTKGSTSSVGIFRGYLNSGKF